MVARMTPWKISTPLQRARLSNRLLHKQIRPCVSDLSDLELHFLCRLKFGDQTKALAMIRGSEKVGTRLLDMSRVEVVESFISAKICDQLFDVCDADLKQLAKMSEASQENELEMITRNPTVPAFLGEARTGIINRINPEIRYKLSCLSDAALQLLRFIAEPDQPKSLKSIEEIDQRMPVPRARWIKKNIAKKWQSELSLFDDQAVLQLGNMDKSKQPGRIEELLKSIKDAKSAAKALKAAEKSKKNEAAEPPSFVVNDEITKKKPGSGGRKVVDLDDEDDDEDEDPGVAVAVSDLSSARRMASELEQCDSRLIGVRLIGQLCRDGDIEMLASCPNSGDAVVFDMEALAATKPLKDLFEDELQPFKRLLESSRVVKVVHDCRAASDALFHLCGVHLEAVFDTAVAWELKRDSTGEAPSIEDVLSKYAPQVLEHRPVAAQEDFPLEEQVCVLVGAGAELGEQDPGQNVCKEGVAKYEAAVAEALPNVAIEMAGSLERKGKRFRAGCQEQLSAFRDWPGQHVDFFGLGERVRVDFLGDRLVLGDGEPPQPEQTFSQEEEESLLRILPAWVREAVREVAGACDGALIEVVLGLDRAPEVRTRNLVTGQLDFVYAGQRKVEREDLDHVEKKIGSDRFNLQDRAGIEGTLHRVSSTRNPVGDIVILTMRIGRPSRRIARLLTDLVAGGESVLLLGPPGVGKTTLLRACASMMSETRSTVIVDPTGEIAGCGDACHWSVGRAWKDMAYSDKPIGRSEARRLAMGRALENMLPQVLIVDEIGTAGEAQAARTIGERGVQLVATAHGRTIHDLIGNSELRDLIGGLKMSTLGDDNPRVKATNRKTITERGSAPVFSTLVEIRSPSEVVVHRDLARAVDGALQKRSLPVQVRSLGEDGVMYIEKQEA